MVHVTSNLLFPRNCRIGYLQIHARQIAVIQEASADTSQTICRQFTKGPRNCQDDTFDLKCHNMKATKTNCWDSPLHSSLRLWSVTRESLVFLFASIYVLLQAAHHFVPDQEQRLHYLRLATLELLDFFEIMSWESLSIFLFTRVHMYISQNWKLLSVGCVDHTP